MFWHAIRRSSIAVALAALVTGAATDGVHAADPATQSSTSGYFSGMSTIGGSLPSFNDDFFFYHDSIREHAWEGPTCDNDRVLREVQSEFDESERRYRDPVLAMVRVDHIRETALRDWQPPLMARRHCTGRAHLSDGRDYALVYWIRSEEGFAGIGWGVTYCLVGRDQFHAYAPACRGLRPQ